MPGGLGLWSWSGKTNLLSSVILHLARSATCPPTSARTSCPSLLTSRPPSPRPRWVCGGWPSAPSLRTAGTTRSATNPLRWATLCLSLLQWYLQTCVCSLGFIEVSGECKSLKDFDCSQTRNISQVSWVSIFIFLIHKNVPLSSFVMRHFSDHRLQQVGSPALLFCLGQQHNTRWQDRHVELRRISIRNRNNHRPNALPRGQWRQL